MGGRTNATNFSSRKLNRLNVVPFKRKPNSRRAPSVNSVAEKAIRSDFITLLGRYISKLRKNPLAFNNTFPTPREHAFSKASMTKPLDTSIRKFTSTVSIADPVLNEKSTLHTHNPLQSFYSAAPSLMDIYFFVERNYMAKKINSVILVFDLGNSYQHFIALARKMHSEAVWRQHDGKNLNFGEKELKNLSDLGRQAAKEFAVSGKVIIQPTKKLIEMSYVNKSNLLTEISTVIQQINTNSSFIGYEKRFIQNYVSTNCRQFFRARYFPTPGYKYEPKRKAFVKT